MSKEQEFLTSLKDWLLENLVKAVSQQAKMAPAAVKNAVKKTAPNSKKKRKYTKRSDFWKTPHPRKRAA